MRTDSVAMLEALDAISEFYVVNTIEARRGLRQDLEFQNITLAKMTRAEYAEKYAEFSGEPAEELAKEYPEELFADENPPNPIIEKI